MRRRLPVAFATLLVCLIAAAPASAALQLTNSFVSSKGWVKPGQAFPLTVRVANPDAVAADGGTVTLESVPGMRFTKVDGGDGASISGGTVTWKVGSVPAGGRAQVVLEATVATTAEDPEIVWKDLSTTAKGAIGSATSHGPKVIPPSEAFDSARYGDRPFPVVPVDYLDRKHAGSSAADLLQRKINDPATAGSTFNLYQEMSYGQLFPHADVPSAGVAARGWDYAPGFAFTKNQVKADTCTGTTTAILPGSAPYTTGNPNRIADGWYQLPGTTQYYGQDSNGSALIGSLAGVGALQSIDSGCGPAGKAVYDAAQIADPDIDYDDFDTDKDGVVDFFMMVFPGRGGNGDSQIPGTDGAYDNIWPHSSSLEESYVDPATGLTGYISDDQARDQLGRPLWYTDESYTKRTTTDMGDKLKAYTRVGPYNVNPESAITKASVISHEYGHSLGLPDFYSTGSRTTYGTWNLMAEDHSQHMDVFGRQELGWLVPRQLQPGHTDVTDAVDSSRDTHRIDWKTADGKPYTLSGERVHNGEAYAAKLPARQIIDPAKVPSGSHLFWSQAGNDFGCPPTKGHNMDLAIPALKSVPAGTPVTLSLESSWQIEWDFDFGFVLTSTDGGKTYASVPSSKGYTTPQSQNTNSNPCQAKYGNGITGSSASYAAGTQALDRVLGNYGADPTFVEDAYDISALAGKDGIVRFTYATDAGLAKKGWFIDDITVKAGDRVIYSTDAETPNDPAVFQGGCKEDLQTATTCTKGWQYTSALDGSPADHGYYLELRDRTGFDADGHGEDDRGDGPTFEPGVSLVYTDENHGYGNVGTDDPPAQSPLDARPEPGSETPDLDDAAFTAADGRNAFSDAAHVDNYTDPTTQSGNWEFKFNCLSFKVNRLSGADVGPANAPGDLRGDLGVDLGSGCAPFDYGYTANASGAPSTPGTSGAQTVCPATPGVKAERRGKGVRFTARGRFTVTVVRRGLQGSRRVFRKRGRGAVTWKARGARDGTYVASIGSRRLVLRRAHGRFSVRYGFRRAGRCGVLRSFTLGGPLFGARGLTAAYRLSARAKVAIVVLRGAKVVRTYAPRARAAGRTYRLRVKARRRGEYTVVLQVKRGDRVVRARLVSRRV